jgi:PKD domain
MLRRLIALAALTLSLAPAAHAAGWVDTGTLSPPDKTAVDAHLLLLPSGERVVAWIQVGGLFQTPENVSVRVAPPGQDFGAVQTFPGFTEDLRAAAGPDGTVALAWISAAQTMHIARLAPGATTFTDVPFGLPSTESLFGDRIAITGGGDVYAALESLGQGPTTSSSIWATRLAAAQNDVRIVPGPGGAGNPLEHFSAARPAPAIFDNDVAIAAEGDRVDIAWARENSAPDNNKASTDVVDAVHLATLGDAFLAPLTLDTIQSTTNSPVSAPPTLAAAAGHVYALWPRHLTEQLELRDLASMGATQSVAARFDQLVAGVDGSGTLLTALTGEPLNTEANSVFAQITPVGTPLPVPAQLTPNGIDRTADDLAVAPDGTALLLIDREDESPGETQVTGLLRQPGATTFGAPEEVSGLRDTGFEADHVASAAVASGGRALVLWEASDDDGTTNQRLHLSERDTAPPVFGAIGVPPSATVGQRADLSAPALDALSGAATVRWDFGDGSQATGASVSHTFGSAGTATVTVTATDSVGNATTQTRTITVAPAPVTTTTTTTGPDRTPPVVSHLTLSHSRFRIGTQATARVAKKKPTKSVATGTTLAFRLSERSTVVITIATHTLVRASIAPGNAKVAFTGRIGSTKLKPGSYRVSVTAIDGAGNRSKPVSAKFTIVSGGSR